MHSQNHIGRAQHLCPLVNRFPSPPRGERQARERGDFVEAGERLAAAPLAVFVAERNVLGRY